MNMIVIGRVFPRRVIRVPPSVDREKKFPPERREPPRRPRKEPEMTESTEWQRIGDVPVDTGRLVLVDPMNLDDVSQHEEELARHLEDEDSEPASMTYELVTNEIGVAVALVLSTGLGDGGYPVEARFEEAEGTMRIAEIRVRFLPHPTVGYELPR
jgi:hypothetical protein